MQLDATQDYNWLTENDVPKAQEFVKKEHLHGIHPHHYQATTATQRVWTVNDEKTFKPLNSLKSPFQNLRRGFI